MTRLLEAKEYVKPVWEAFKWNIDGIVITGHLFVIDESKEVKRVRVAIGIPSDAMLISYGTITRSPIDWDLETGKPKYSPEPEEAVEISWWSPGLMTGSCVQVPREVAVGRDDRSPLRIQVVDVSLYSYNSFGTTLDNIS